MLAAPDWFDDEFLGIRVEQYLGILLLAVIAATIRLLVVGLITLVIRRRSQGDDRAFWTMERRRLDLALLLLAIGVTFLIGFPLLDFGTDVTDIVTRIAGLVAALAIILLAYRAIDILVDVMTRRARQTETKLDDNLVPLMRTSLRLFVGAVGLLFVLSNIDVDVSSLIAGLGIGGLAFALAAQDTVKNLFGGVTIFADKPFEVGDWVVVDGIEGTVEQVGFRSTRVRTFYNSQVTVPNGRLIDAGIDNMGRRRWRRYKTTLGVGYHTTPDQMQAFVEGIRAIIRAKPDMRQDYYIVEFHGFGAASLDVLVYCFIDAADWNDELRARHVFNLDIMRLAERLGVDFAFPTQTIHVAEMPGQPMAQRSAPTRDELREVVDGFGPTGSNGQRTDQPITEGYDNIPNAAALRGGEEG